MSELANYSIETDQTVLLSFKDGRNIRAAITNLPRLLPPRDVEKVMRALKLRHDFITRHMPKAAALIVATGLLALLVAGGGALAQLWTRRTEPEPAPPHSTLVRSIERPSPEVTPSTGPAVASPVAATVAQPITKTTRSRTQIK